MELNSLMGGGGSDVIGTLSPFSRWESTFIANDNSEWLKTGVVETDASKYPDAYTNLYPEVLSTVSGTYQGIILLGDKYWAQTTSDGNLREYNKSNHVATGRVIDMNSPLDTYASGGAPSPASAPSPRIYLFNSSHFRVYNPITLTEVAGAINLDISYNITSITIDPITSQPWMLAYTGTYSNHTVYFGSTEIRGVKVYRADGVLGSIVGGSIFAVDDKIYINSASVVTELTKNRDGGGALTGGLTPTGKYWLSESTSGVCVGNRDEFVRGPSICKLVDAVGVQKPLLDNQGSNLDYSIKQVPLYMKVK
jgi:hypothetical protein